MHPDSLLARPQALPRCRFWEDDAKGGVSTGLAAGFLHEFHAPEAGDAAAAAGLVAGIAIASTGNRTPAIWLRARRGGSGDGPAGAVIQGAGWAELGGAPETCVFVLAEDALALLRAGLDAVRSGGARVVVIEGRGRMPELDLTASRRLSLAAAKAGVLLVLLRSEGQPAPSAAQTRWAVASAPSRALAANAPGLPSFDIELLRHRSGPAGGRWRLEWDRDRRVFREAPFSGAVVSIPAGGAAAAGGTGDGSRYAA